MDFNSGSPVELTNGQMNTNEGCATICDASGNLLFYTDGMSVWNKPHNIMQGGSGTLSGNTSSTQSSLTVPKPGAPDLYYIFTVKDCEHTMLGGLEYSIVDMTMNGGNGAVTSLNNNLLDNSGSH